MDNVQRNFIVRNLKDFLAYRVCHKIQSFIWSIFLLQALKKQKSNKLEVKNSIIYIYI